MTGETQPSARFTVRRQQQPADSTCHGISRAVGVGPRITAAQILQQGVCTHRWREGFNNTRLAAWIHDVHDVGADMRCASSSTSWRVAEARRERSPSACLVAFFGELAVPSRL